MLQSPSPKAPPLHSKFHRFPQIHSDPPPAHKLIQPYYTPPQTALKESQGPIQHRV